jgi:glycosyltransferase 2 family protein
MGTTRSRSWIATLIGVLVSAGLLTLALRSSDPAAISQALQKTQPAYALPFLAALFLYYWVKTVRWADLLAPLAVIPARRLFSPVMIGYAGSAILPLQLGEVARTFLVARRERLTGASVLMTIAVERIFDLIGVLLLLGCALALGSTLPPVLIKAGYVIALGTVFASAIVMGYVYKPEPFMTATRRMAAWLPARAGGWIVQQVEQAVHGLAVLRDVRLLLRIAVTSIVQWLFMWSCVWLSIEAVGLDATADAAFVVLVLTIIGISLPNSPGYVGSIQIAYVLGLAPFGIAAGPAVAASIFFHVLAYASVVLVGLVLLHRTGSDLGTLIRASREPPNR